MEQKLKKLFPLQHPQHVILGVGLIGMGLILIFDDYYFFWPPFAVKVLNDDLIGGVFVVIGLLLLKWAFRHRIDSRIYAWI